MNQAISNPGRILENTDCRDNGKGKREKNSTEHVTESLNLLRFRSSNIFGDRILYTGSTGGMD